MPTPAVLQASAMTDLPALAQLLARCCTDAGADAEVLSALRLASEEVFTNTLLHGYRSRTGPIRVTVAHDARAITVTLSDRAPDFDPARLAAPDTTCGWQLRPIGGLGWHLVQQLMDTVQRTPADGGGNVYTLVKQLPPRTPSPSSTP